MTNQKMHPVAFHWAINDWVYMPSNGRVGRVTEQRHTSLGHTYVVEWPDPSDCRKSCTAVLEGRQLQAAPERTDASLGWLCAKQAVLDEKSHHTHSGPDRVGAFMPELLTRAQAAQLLLVFVYYLGINDDDSWRFGLHVRRCPRGNVKHHTRCICAGTIYERIVEKLFPQLVTADPAIQIGDQTNEAADECNQTTSNKTKGALREDE